MKTPTLENFSSKQYRKPLTPEEFAAKFNYPPAMVRLAIDCGLEAPGGKITGAAFCQWFTEHYNDFRTAAGLPRLHPPSARMSREDAEMLTIGNVIQTHADYFASRTSSLAHKEEWMSLSNDVACRSRRLG